MSDPFKDTRDPLVRNMERRSHERDAKDAARYRWLKGEDRKTMPLGTISWRMQGNGMPCKLADSDNLDALIDTAIANLGATVKEIYDIAAARTSKPQGDSK